MIRITKQQREELDRVGLLRYKTKGKFAQDQNFVVVNRSHRSRHKTHYVVEEKEIMLFLEKYDDLNLQKIRPGQLKHLKDIGMLGEAKIQYPGEYKPGAIAYIDSKGQCRIKKVTKIMIELGIWTTNGRGESND